MLPLSILVAKSNGGNLFIYDRIISLSCKIITLNQIKLTVADDCLYLTENNVRHKRFFMINFSWFTGFITCTRVSLVISTVLVLTRATLSWYVYVQIQQYDMQHKQDFSFYFRFANLVIIVGYINKHKFQTYHHH